MLCLADHEPIILSKFVFKTVCRLYPGDMGGLMGLLIGGSVITLLEVLDLLVYNSIRKCHEQNKK